MDSQSFLDEMIEEDSVQILKAALPYLPASGQSFVSIFAKSSGASEYHPSLYRRKRPDAAVRPVPGKGRPSGNAHCLQQCLPRRCKRAPGQSYQRHCHDTNV